MAPLHSCKNLVAAGVLACLQDRPLGRVPPRLPCLETRSLFSLARQTVTEGALARPAVALSWLHW